MYARDADTGAWSRLMSTPASGGPTRKIRPVPSVTECAIFGSSSSVDLWIRFASRSYRPSSLFRRIQSGSVPTSTTESDIRPFPTAATTA